MNIKRWIYVCFGALVMLFAGLIYGWSVYQAAMAPDFPGWTAAQFSLNFSLCMTFFCFGTLSCGIFSRKVSPRIMLIAAAVLILVGFLLTSRAMTPGGLYLGYGVLAGFSIGMVYNTVMSTILKWFPEKAGLISGILLMGFGFSAMLMGPLFTAIAQASGWRFAFVLFGVIMAVIFLLGALILRAPKETAAAASGDCGESLASNDTSPFQMLRQGRFWGYFIWAICLSGAGLAVNAHSYAMAETILLAENPLASVSGLPALVALFSVFNGLGRVAFGALFDRSCRRMTMNLIGICYLASAGVMIFAVLQNSFVLILAGLICFGFSYGGVMPSNSAYVRSAFGAKYYPVNFSIVTLNLLAASYVGPLVSGALYDASGSYVGTVLCALLLAVVGVVCAGAITLMEKKTRR